MSLPATPVSAGPHSPVVPASPAGSAVSADTRASLAAVAAPLEPRVEGYQHLMDKYDWQNFQKSVQECRKLEDEVTAIKRDETKAEQELLAAQHKSMLARKEILPMEQHVSYCETALSLTRVKLRDARHKLEYETISMQRKSRKRPRDQV